MALRRVGQRSAASGLGRGWLRRIGPAGGIPAPRLGVHDDLRHALEAEQLEVHYQPIGQLSSGLAFGAEALLRWRHATLGWVSPEDIMAVAEDVGLAQLLTRWVLEKALRQCGQWRSFGYDLTVAVNLDTRSLMDADLPAAIQQLLTDIEAAPEWLALDVTEMQVDRDPRTALDVLNRVHELGVALAVDDFGTGSSSLACVTRLPVDEIKIDTSFVQQMRTDPTAEKVVRSVVGLGASLGKTVVAEGVEDLMTWDALVAAGCHLAQGYYLSRALPAAGLEKWLVRRARRITPPSQEWVLVGSLPPAFAIERVSS
jgi:EAL domain-containing protein (putative c-di-GMP-specific phosphodiesterase class I)